jgi:tetratricopeptide (TPR) repeat protein
MAINREFSVEGEEFWRELSVYLEWSNGFALIFLFCNNAQITQLVMDHIKAIHIGNENPLHYFAPTSPETLIVESLDFVQSFGDSGQKSPVWLDLSQYGDQWSTPQLNVIQRINERRDGIRKHNPQPLIIVLNTDFAQKVPFIAPDLWSVRTYSRLLRPDFLVDVETVERILAAPDEDAQHSGDKVDDIEKHPLLVEWRRLVAMGAQGIDVVSAGYDAFGVVFDAGYYQEAQEIADVLTDKARELGSESVEQLRATMLTVGCIAQINEVNGDLEQAKSSYTEALNIARQIHQLVGDEQKVLRDISVSLDKLGKVNQQLGELAQASTLFSESLALRRQLQQSLGDQPPLLRDVSVSLENLGNIYQSMRDLSRALPLCTEALCIRQQLQSLLGDQPQVLQDICLSQIKLGEIYQLQSDQNKALDCFNQSLELLHRLQKLTPQAAYINEWFKIVNTAVAQVSDKK